MKEATSVIRTFWIQPFISHFFFFRFTEIRNTIQGKQEERLPFFSFRFPDWFKKIYKTAYDNFQNNLDKLVTPFDIHNTLKSVLDLKDTGVADIKQRSVSLFTKVYF